MCMFDAYCVTDGYEIFSNDKDRDNKYMNVGEVTKDFKIGKPTRKGTSPTESLCHLSPEQLKKENPGDPWLTWKTAV